MSGHLQVRGSGRDRKYFALWIDADGVKHTRTLGRAHVKDTGRRTSRGAVVWRAGDGECPAGSVTPKMAEAALAEILDEAAAPRVESVPAVDARPIPTFGDAVALWLDYLRVERQRKASTLRDARNAAHGYLVPRFGADTPLYAIERHEVIVHEGGRSLRQVRDEQVDTFATEDVDEFRRELLDSHLSPRTV